jgi:hypothetical protein
MFPAPAPFWSVLAFRALIDAWLGMSSDYILRPSFENSYLCLIFLTASSMRFLSMMSPICSRLMENAMISMARRPSRSSRPRG